MRLDLSPIRPAVIDAGAYERLDELRRYRHLFRSAYTLRIDPQRLEIVLQKAQELRELFPPQIEQFIQFLQTLSNR